MKITQIQLISKGLTRNFWSEEEFATSGTNLDQVREVRITTRMTPQEFEEAYGRKS